MKYDIYEDFMRKHLAWYVNIKKLKIYLETIKTLN